MRKITTISLVLLAIFLASCGGGEKFTKNPVDVLVRDMNAESIFSIILYDMEVEGNFSKTFRHQYQIITEKDGLPETKVSEWYPVSEKFFALHEENMGMEIATKDTTGKVSKGASPAGYNNYVGNPQYGQWSKKSDGSSFWEFYGKYAMLSSVFRMMSYPARYSYWNDYRSNYYGSGRSYYGPNSGGRSYYGTYSDSNTKSRTNSRYTKSSNFKNKVNNKVTRSTGNRSKTTAKSSTKKTRSSNRYTGSSRSRSYGGSGK